MQLEYFILGFENQRPKREYNMTDAPQSLQEFSKRGIIQYMSAVNLPPRTLARLLKQLKMVTESLQMQCPT